MSDIKQAASYTLSAKRYPLVVAYEPIDAIGTGHPTTPENAEEVASLFKKNYDVQHVLYGGSVTSKNVRDFTQMPSIDGVLIGGASLDVQEFYDIVKNA
jgi:triosephosphate isomerase (TIM)